MINAQNPNIPFPEDADTFNTLESETHSRASLVCRNIAVNGRRTSMRIEAVLWDCLNVVCKREGVTINELCSRIEKIKGHDVNLTAAVRTFLVAYFRYLATERGHALAGHGIIPADNGPSAAPTADPLKAVLGELLH